MDKSKYEEILLGDKEFVVEAFELSNVKKTRRKTQTSNTVILSNQRLYLVGKTRKGAFHVRVGTFYINLNAITSAEKTIEKNTAFIVLAVFFLFSSVIMFFVERNLLNSFFYIWILFISLAIWVMLFYFLTIKKAIKVYYSGGVLNIPCNNLSEVKVNVIFSGIANHFR